MIKLLIGGSPCTHWSIAQTKKRETKPEGIGWELFENFLIALAKFKPDYFLYENNKSMSPAIRAEITKRFGFEPVCINSAKVSAQNRQRLYWCGKRNPDGTYSRVDVEQPEDRGILLRDILEKGNPVNDTTDGKSQCLRATYYKDGIRNMVGNTVDRKTCVAVPAGMAWSGHERNGNSSSFEMRSDGKSNAVIVGHQNRLVIEDADGKTFPVYEVRNGLITINGKQHPIKLADGFYTIRKLTVTECKRLQTVPDSYVFPVSDTQAYKMLGNGWTVDVIAHILSHCSGITAAPLDVLSMYDGMACGHIALDKLGATITRYRATEIDKYAIKTACYNFPDIEQLGDAFQVRGW